jgi:hypothetical protein
MPRREASHGPRWTTRLVAPAKASRNLSGRIVAIQGASMAVNGDLFILGVLVLVFFLQVLAVLKVRAQEREVDRLKKTVGRLRRAAGARPCPHCGEAWRLPPPSRPASFRAAGPVPHRPGG